MKHTLRVVLLHVLLALSVGAPAFATEKYSGPSSAYIAVIDAGSSGSRIYLYGTGAKGTLDVQDRYEFEPDVDGLGTFADRPEQAGTAGIKPLLDGLTAHLAEKGIAKQAVEIHLLATAGMRLIGTVQAEQIYKSARDTISASGFTAGRIETITGQMEAYYAWADINLLLGTFQNKTPSKGIIEIGGASAQVAFQSADAAGPNVISKTINGVRYPVTSISFLGLGQNEARKSMIQSTGAGAGAQNNSCYPAGSQVSDKKVGVTALTGSFNYEQCGALYATVIEQHAAKTTSATPEFKATTFIAVGKSMIGSIENWKVSATTPAALVPKVQSECTLNWSQFAQRYGTSIHNQNQCADSTYSTTLLFSARGLALTDNQILIIDTIERREPTWTRGFVAIMDAANQ